MTSEGRDANPRKRIGVFGGTFDPIHIGHLILADEAHYQLNLDVVYLVPAADPPHKRGRRLSTVEQRLHMARLATIEWPWIHISRIDTDRPGPHYTADMVRVLEAQTDDEADIFFLMGTDSLRDLPAWHEPQWLVAHCTLVALTRNGVVLDWDALEAALPGIRDRVLLLDMPEMEISSSAIQQRIREGRPWIHQVPPAAAAYITANGLYSEPG